VSSPRLHPDRRHSLTLRTQRLRAFDISEAYRPKAVGAFVPATPEGLIDPRPGSAELAAATGTTRYLGGIRFPQGGKVNPLGYLAAPGNRGCRA
jgi:hypothetical protein